MIRILALVALLLPVSVVAAPVPAHLMPRTEVQLRYDPAHHFETIIRNNGAADLQIWSNQAYGVAAFLDYEVVNAEGERVSRFLPLRRPPQDGAKVVLCQTIPAKRSITCADRVFQFVDEKKLTAGRYKVRVHFDYKDQHATSNWVGVDILESQIRLKMICPLP